MVNTSDSGSRGRWFEPHSGCRVVSLSKTYLPPKKRPGNTQEAVAPSQHDLNIAFRDVRHMTKPKNTLFYMIPLHLKELIINVYFEINTFKQEYINMILKWFLFGGISKRKLLFLLVLVIGCLILLYIYLFYN